MHSKIIYSQSIKKYTNETGVGISVQLKSLSLKESNYNRFLSLKVRLCFPPTEK